MSELCLFCKSPLTTDFTSQETACVNTQCDAYADAETAGQAHMRVLEEAGFTEPGTDKFAGAIAFAKFLEARGAIDWLKLKKERT